MSSTFKVTLPSGVTITVTNPESSAAIGGQQQHEVQSILGDLAHGYTSPGETAKVERVS